MSPLLCRLVVDDDFGKEPNFLLAVIPVVETLLTLGVRLNDILLPLMMFNTIALQSLQMLIMGPCNAGFSVAGCRTVAERPTRFLAF